MEETLQQNIPNNISPINNKSREERKVVSHKVIITVFVVLTVLTILFLIYQNGRSVYYQGV